MDKDLRIQIYRSTDSLPQSWDEVAAENIFLSRNYLQVLSDSAPQNMQCFFIGLFEHDNLVGVALAQFLNLGDVQSFGERDSCFKKKVRDFVFRRFSSNVLIMGNNMLTGQNSFMLKNVSTKKAAAALLLATREIESILQSQKIKTHLTIFKDFLNRDVTQFGESEFASYFKFSTQPNMVFAIPEQWSSPEDYLAAFSKKYRDQYKRARKKADCLTKRKISLDEIIANEQKIHDLYMNVARHAPFNTFYLATGHFAEMKKSLHDKFLFYGYFDNEQLIGFNTLIKNGKDIDTYFLGYDEMWQREKMLYLNMLFDMVCYSIKKGYKRIVFGRTALEIKSGVGANPVPMYGFIKHSNRLLNVFMPKLFSFFEPELKWQQRNPFKEPQLSSADAQL